MISKCCVDRELETDRQHPANVGGSNFKDRNNNQSIYVTDRHQWKNGQEKTSKMYVTINSNPV